MAPPANLFPRAIPLLRELDPGGDYPFRRSLDGLYEVFSYFRVEPKMLTDVIPWEPLSATEISELEKALKRKLDESHAERLGRGLFRFLAGVALADKVPSWSDLRDRLRMAREGADLLLASLGPRADQDKAGGFLTADQAMAEFFRSHGVKLAALNKLLEACRYELAEVRPRVSTPGGKGDVSLRILMVAFVSVASSADADLTVGSNVAPEDPNFKPPPLLRAARIMLEIGRRRGPDAFSRSNHLTRDGFSTSMRRLVQQTNKSNRALMDHLRNALAVMRRPK